MEKKNEPDKLAQESTQAIAAGMSYGKWKAMQNPVKIQKPPLPADWRVCPWCGTPFKLKNNRAKIYCDIICQRAAQYARDKQKEKEHSTKEEQSQ